MKLFALVLFILLLATSCKHESQINTVRGRDTLLIYLMAGQSNMAGRGIIEPQDTMTDPLILSMDMNDQFVLAKEPLNFYQPGLSGLDCGVSFARTLLPYAVAGTRVGLIQCAVGSTRLEEWLHDSVRVVPLYTNCVRRAHHGMRKGIVKGILWHQGEANAEDTTSRQYAANMQALIRNWRRDLGDEQLPVFIAKLAAFCKRPYRDEVNAGIDATANALPNVFVIETADLTCKADSIHFDSRSQRIMGERFAQVAAQFVRR